MSELALVPEIRQWKDEQAVVEPEIKWHSVLDHVTVDGDRFTVVVDANRLHEPSAYRVNFVERGGERALGMLVQKAGWYGDSDCRWRSEIVFGKHHRLDSDVQRQEWVYIHPSEDDERVITDKLFPIAQNT